MASSNKGSEWKDHKYVAKVKVTPSTYRYFYSMSDYKAYLSKKKAKQAVKNVRKSAKEVSDFVSKNSKKLISDISNAVDAGKNFVNKVKDTAAKVFEVEEVRTIRVYEVSHSTTNLVQKKD